MNKTFHVFEALLCWRKMVGSQQTYDQRVFAGKETHLKKSCHGSKGPFQIHRTQYDEVIYLNKNNVIV